MRQFTGPEWKLNAERRIHYRGTARVRLENLYFEWNEPRELSRKNVDRLKEIYRTESVHRLEAKNHIPAVVDHADLNAALQASEVSAEVLLNNSDSGPPELKFPRHYRVTCLHGLHRIQAARESLPLVDAWWTVDFYLKGTNANPDLRITLEEEYSNEEKPSDGEIYRKIRQYGREGNIYFKKRWTTRLSDHGRRSLRQLFDHGEGELVAAFDSLLDIPGLWDGMRISTLHKVIGIKCDEEVLHYLEHIKKVWHKLLRGDKAALRKVDQATVKALELRAPKYSRQDALHLQGHLLSGQIFGAFSTEEREEIWSELLAIDGLIPSLFTFFEDVKYLSACSDCMKRLVKLSRRDTMSSALRRKFSPHDYAHDGSVLEVADSSFVVHSGAATDHLDWGYRQLWLFAMRHYRKVPTEPRKRTKDLLAKAAVEKADEHVLSEFAALADRLGFDSHEIQTLKQRSSDREIARTALLKARKSDRYQYGERALEAYITQIVNLFTYATPLPCESPSANLVSDDPDASGNRCGFPDEDAQKEDSKCLFLPYLHKASEERGEAVTSFFVRRSVYLAFFGKTLDLGELQLERQDQERQDEERQEQDRLARLEQERQEQVRLEQERLEQERLEQVRLEQERLEQVRLEQERLEQVRLEQERLEQVRLEQERLEQEHFEQVRLEQERLEQERLEQVRLEQERLEQVRLEQERLEQVRLEQERLEQERLVQARQLQKRLEEERLEQERQENSERARKRHTQFDMHSVLQRDSRVDPSGASTAQDEGQLQVLNPQSDKNSSQSNLQPATQVVESVGGNDRTIAAEASQPPENDLFSRLKNSMPTAPQGAQNSIPSRLPGAQPVRITYFIWERDGWRTAHTLDTDRADPSEVERVAIKYMRKRIRLFDKELIIQTPRSCFKAATSDGSNTIFLIPEAEINIGERLESSIAELISNTASDPEEGSKKRGRRGDKPIT